MELTEVSVHLPPIFDASPVLAYCNVVFDNVFVVKGIRVVEAPNSRRLVVMPSRQSADKTYHDVCHPISSRFRRQMEATILAAVDERKQSQHESTPRRSTS